MSKREFSKKIYVTIEGDDEEGYLVAHDDYSSLNIDIKETKTVAVYKLVSIQVLESKVEVVSDKKVS